MTWLPTIAGGRSHHPRRTLPVLWFPMTSLQVLDHFAGSCQGLFLRDLAAEQTKAGRSKWQTRKCFWNCQFQLRFLALPSYLFSSSTSKILPLTWRRLGWKRSPPRVKQLVGSPSLPWHSALALPVLPNCSHSSASLWLCYQNKLTARALCGQLAASRCCRDTDLSLLFHTCEDASKGVGCNCVILCACR